MTESTTTPFRSARALLRRLAVMLLLTLTAVVAVSGTASARVGDVRALPGYYGTGTVAMDGYFSGRVWWDYSSGPYCVYVQYKHVASLGLDGTWNRMTGNSCGAPLFTYWSQPTDRAFNGMKFRLCQAKPNALDPCGSSVTIYTTW